jgi:hypothetical protein
MIASLIHTRLRMAGTRLRRKREAPGPPIYLWPARALLTRMDAGVHWINHLGHGRSSSAMKLFAAPYATTTRPCGTEGATEQIKSDMECLTTSDYFFVYSEACLPGRFDDSECLAEYLTTKSPRGAFAVIMNAREGLGVVNRDVDGVSLRFHRLFWNAVFNGNLSGGPESLTYGAVNQWSKEAVWFGWDDLLHPPPPEQEHWGGWTDVSTRHCFYELNLFGDPSLTILTPQSP